MVTWWYSEGGFQVGPVDPDCIRRLLQERRVGSHTLFWRHGMAEWLPAPAIPELCGFVPPEGAVREARPRLEERAPAIAPFTAAELVGSNVWQRLIATVTGLALVSLTLFVAATTMKAVLGNRADAAEAAQAADSSLRVWQNPVTRRNARIDPAWQARTSVSLGQRDYLFADAAQHKLLKLTREDAQGMSLQRFVATLRQKTAREVALTGEGRFGWRNGAPLWQAEGHLIGNPELLLQIQLLQIGSTYWQIITLRNTADAAAVGLLDALRDELWKTIGDPVGTAQ